MFINSCVKAKDLDFGGVPKMEGLSMCFFFFEEGLVYFFFIIFFSPIGDSESSSLRGDPTRSL